MEKQVNRDQYFKEFFEIVDSIGSKNIKQFLERVKCHKYFGKYKELLEKPGITDRELLILILCELTRDRATCNAMIKILEESGFKKEADKMKTFNQTSQQLPFDSITGPDIPDMYTVSHPKENQTMTYCLSKKKRGVCVIINNVEPEQIRGFPDGLKNETKRLRSLMERLNFEVIEPLISLKAKEIQPKLENIRDTKISKDDEAFALFVVSHGENGKVLGSIACDYLVRIRNKEITKSHPDYQKALHCLNEDTIHIDEIIKIFNEKKCDNLKNKPKLLFFICCRVKQEYIPDPNVKRPKVDSNLGPLSPPRMTNPHGMFSFNQDYQSGSNEYKYIDVVTQKVEDMSLDTFVVFTCAQGFKTFFDLAWGMTYFTQALTLSIVQYACDLPLSELMSRTLQRLEDKFKTRHDWHFGNFAIEARQYGMKKALYFNPGYSE